MEADDRASKKEGREGKESFVTFFTSFVPKKLTVFASIELADRELAKRSSSFAASPCIRDDRKRESDIEEARGISLRRTLRGEARASER